MNATPVSLTRAVLVCGLVFFGAASVSAQQAEALKALPRSAIAAEVLSSGVRFSRVPSSVSALPMCRVEVPIQAHNNARLLEDKTADVPNKDWVDKIKVTVTLGYAVDKKGAKAAEGQFAFYRAASTILSMKKNTRGSVFFYLPGEILERDRLRPEPMGYVVDIEVDGKPMPSFMSNNLKRPEQYEGFRTKADAGVFKNAGMLLPQYHVPDDRRPPSPALIREDSTR